MTDLLLEIPIEERTVAAVLSRQVRERPDKVALRDLQGGSLTYSELEERALTITGGVSRLGVGRQETVLVMLDNNIDHVLVWLGITLGAMIEVPINTAFKGELLKLVVERSDASVLIIDSKYCDRLDAVEGASSLKTVIVYGDQDVTLPDRFIRLAYNDLHEGIPIRPDPPAVWDICTVLFTSGTEGLSKGVLCPHGHALAMASYPPMAGPEEIAFVALPLFHAAGLWAGVLNSIRCGGTALIVEWFSASSFWRQVREFGCTTTVLMGAMVEFLWKQPPSDDERDHSLNLAVVIPAPANPSAIQKRWGVDVGSAYGLTEAGTVMISEPGKTKKLGIGQPRAHVEIRLVDENDLEVKQGEVGEIVLRSAEPWSMMAGYLGLPSETARACRNLWLHSGDAAFQDADGDYIFVDRRKDALRRRGENVSSHEVERLILEREDIDAAAVVGVASEYGEDELKAFVVLRHGAQFEPEAILRDLVTRLPYFMVPRYMEPIQDLPRTLTHKVLKEELRQRGNTEAWDCEAMGFRVTRDGLISS